MSPVRHLLFIGLLLASAILRGADSSVYMAAVPSDSNLSLLASLTAATGRLRLQDWTLQRQQVAQSRRDLGAAWLGDAPRLAGSWRDYDWNNNSELYEAEIYFTMPLWRAGERKALRTAAEKDETLVAFKPRPAPSPLLPKCAAPTGDYWMHVPVSSFCNNC